MYNYIIKRVSTKTIYQDPHTHDTVTVMALYRHGGRTTYLASPTEFILGLLYLKPMTHTEIIDYYNKIKKCSPLLSLKGIEVAIRKLAHQGVLTIEGETLKLTLGKNPHPDTLRLARANSTQITECMNLSSDT